MARIRSAALGAAWLGMALWVAPAFAQEQPAMPQDQPTPEQLSGSDAPLQFFQQPRPQSQTAQPSMQQQADRGAEAGTAPLSGTPRMSLEPVSPRHRAALDDAVRERLRIELPDLHTQVRVNVSEVGVVRLSGQVANLAAKLAVGNIASEVPDYDYVVVNDVLVRPPNRDDRVIASDIRQAFSRDPFLRGADVEIQVRNQTVFLAGGTAPATGPIDELVIVDRAVQTAARVAGVREVINDGIL